MSVSKAEILPTDQWLKYWLTVSPNLLCMEFSSCVIVCCWMLKHVSGWNIALPLHYSSSHIALSQIIAVHTNEKIEARESELRSMQMRELRSRAKIGRVMQDTKPDSKYPAYEAFSLYIHYLKILNLLIPPSPITIYNGVSPAWIWHLPVTIKGETHLLKPHPNCLNLPLT